MVDLAHGTMHKRPRFNAQLKDVRAWKLHSFRCKFVLLMSL